MQVVPQENRVSPDSILEPVRKAYPDLKLTFLRLPQKPNDTYEVRMESKDDQRTNVYVNPYTGAILGSLQWDRTLMGIVYDIHYKLLAGDAGEKVVGVCGLLLLLLDVTGIILWPGWKQFAQGFTIRWQSPRQLVNYDVHKVGGSLSGVFLILIAFTGAGMIFHSEFESVVYSLANTPKPIKPLSTVVVGKLPIPISEVLQKADAALPEGKTISIGIPKKPDGAFRVFKKIPGEVREFGRSRVEIDQYSGEVLRVENSLVAPLATKIMNAFFPLHTGIYGGLTMRIIYVLIGFAPAVLSISGYILWWSKTYGAKSARKQRSQS